jgi:hypothetical protein
MAAERPHLIKVIEGIRVLEVDAPKTHPDVRRDGKVLLYTE